MGVPVISSDVGGQAELITNDVGIIVPCMQKENEILNFNYTEEEIRNYVESIQKILNNLQIYKSKCRERILQGFTTNKMIKNMEKELEDVAYKPNLEKIKNGVELSKNIDILKELISTYFISNKSEYEWLCNDFNLKNIHSIKLKNNFKKKINYEKTLEYKIKHPIVVALRKIGIYDKTKRILGMS